VETFYPLTVKPSSGKATVSIGQRDISPHLLTAENLDLSVVLGSFGATSATVVEVGKLQPIIDPAALGSIEKAKLQDAAVKYAAKEELAHTFREDAKSPAIAITLAFTLAVLGGFLGLLGLVS
jgi:oligosaccharyltransferase complex subunit delta (ribophorin II)